MKYKKYCRHCGKDFTCNGGCMGTIRKIGHMYERCWCPECANRVHDDYPADLKEVCSRFKESKEKVVFT